MLKLQIEVDNIKKKLKKIKQKLTLIVPVVIKNDTNPENNNFRK